jgi:hypothetical protein
LKGEKEKREVKKKYDVKVNYAKYVGVDLESQKYVSLG